MTSIFSEKIQAELDQEKSLGLIEYQKSKPRSYNAIISDLSHLVRNSRIFTEEALAYRLVHFVEELEIKGGMKV